MANRIVSVHAGIYGMGIYAIMLPSSGFSVAHWEPAALFHYVALIGIHGIKFELHIVDATSPFIVIVNDVLISKTYGLILTTQIYQL